MMDCIQVLDRGAYAKRNSGQKHLHLHRKGGLWGIGEQDRASIMHAVGKSAAKSSMCKTQAVRGWRLEVECEAGVDKNDVRLHLPMLAMLQNCRGSLYLLPQIPA